MYVCIMFAINYLPTVNNTVSHNIQGVQLSKKLLENVAYIHSNYLKIMCFMSNDATSV